MLLPCFAETVSAHGVNFACRSSRNSLVYEARFLGATGSSRLLKDDFLLGTFLKDGIYNSEKKIRTSILMELDGTNFHVQFRFYTETIENFYVSRRRLVPSLASANVFENFGSLICKRSRSFIAIYEQQSELTSLFASSGSWSFALLMK